MLGERDSLHASGQLEVSEGSTELLTHQRRDRGLEGDAGQSLAEGLDGRRVATASDRRRRDHRLDEVLQQIPSRCLLRVSVRRVADLIGHNIGARREHKVGDESVADLLALED